MQQLEKQLKDQLRQLDDAKEQIYEHENKRSELELHLEEFKNELDDKMALKDKELAKLRDSESELNRKYEALKKKHDEESSALKNLQENEKIVSDQRMAEIESQLKETQDAFEMAKQTWAKDQAVLK